MSAGRAARVRADFASARLAFRHLPIAHVATCDPNGSPHVVPLWFVWLEEAIYVSTRRGSRTVRNLATDPRIALSVHRGEAWTEHVGVAVQGRADLLRLEDPPARRVLSAWFDKYREELSGRGFATYTAEVEDPVIIRVHSVRLTGWGR